MTLRIVGRGLSRLLLTCVVLACGCSRDKASSGGAADSVASAHAAPPSPNNGAPKDTVSGAGRLNWTLGGLEERLRDNGLDVIRAGTITQPFMGPPGAVYNIIVLRDDVKGGQLQAYIYGDADAVGRDTDKLDTTKVSPPNMMINWVMPPSLIIDNNLAVILLTRDRALRERVKRAITVKPTKHGGGRP